ncbi:MAG: nodulation protein NfeD [Spirochaetales bacterium]|nr:MAG: nodulation protein NfeD [Spirochaetales bacterium]
MALLILISNPLFAQSSQTAIKATVYVIPIKGDIEPSTAVFVQRRAEQALADGASVIVFSIDTFGGRVDSALRISAYIGSIRDAKTIAFVGAGPDGMGVSWSAGALIAFSCSEIYMAPGTSIGAAAPVVATPEGTMEGAGEKTVSAVRAQMAALAEKNGHPAAIALAMVDADTELVEVTVDGRTMAVLADDAVTLERDRRGEVTRGRVIVGKGKLLSLTAGEAERYSLSEGTVRDLDELAVSMGLAGGVVELSPTFSDSVVVFLTSAAVQSLLILIGLMALFLEINSPGFGLPGTVAIIAFLILFGSNMMMGTVGSAELVLFILGMGLLAVEIFLLPGFGLAGISGLILIAAALVLSMQDFVMPQADWQWDILARNAATVGAGVLLGIVGIGVIVAVGPRLKLFDRLTLKTAITGTASGQPAPSFAETESIAVPIEIASADESIIRMGPDRKGRSLPAIGTRGTAVTTLRPSGRADIDGVSLSVETDGLFVEEGMALVVTGIRGGVVFVAPIKA